MGHPGPFPFRGKGDWRRNGVRAGIRTTGPLGIREDRRWGLIFGISER